jgi:hypothetical protein
VEIDDKKLYESTVARAENWLGELSNMVLSANAARLFPSPPLNDVSYFGLPDIATLLCAVSIGPVAILRDHLSGFRQHGNQTTSALQSTGSKIAHLAWTAFALHAWKVGHIDTEKTIHAMGVSTRRMLSIYHSDDTLAEYFIVFNSLSSDLPKFYSAFTRYWSKILSSCPDTNPLDWNRRSVI